MATQPRYVEGDEIFEAYFFDDTPMTRVVMRWWFQVDGVLDPQMLHDSLSQLISLPTWRRLGGRLRLNTITKRLEFHIPPVFDSDRPAVRFSHSKINIPLANHPVSDYLPRPTPENPSVQYCLDSASFSQHFPDMERLPVNFYPYLTTDQPPIALQIISFEDHTLVTLNLPHALTDAIGLSLLIKNWCHILAKPSQINSSQIPPLPGSDPLLLLPRPKEPYVLHDQLMTPFKFTLLKALYFKDMLLGPKMSPQMRVLFLPARKIRSLLSYYTPPPPQSPTEQEQSTITTSDLLTALSLHSIIHTLPPQILPPRSLTILNHFELRSRLPALFPRSQTHIQNAFDTATCLIPSSQSKKLSPYQLALRLRRALKTQTTPQQISSIVSAQQQSLTRNGRPAVYSLLNGLILPASNWARCDFWNAADFSPAVAAQGQGKGKGTGKVVMYNAFDADRQLGSRHRNVTNILGKDEEGNYWVAGTLSQNAWVRLLGMVGGVPDLEDDRQQEEEEQVAELAGGEEMPTVMNDLPEGYTSSPGATLGEDIDIRGPR
ncbi:hypothetical protein QBC44DRAFT_396730 [Cladorrhinum sp. PSN332]|nr:hypothetical protein QBC44DRAFT_396730 [Cladorrhinum sp. PSN332]